MYHGDFTTAGGRRVAERIIAAGRVPRAVVCANDQTAIGVMTALQHAGLSVPGDVAVTGFDGIIRLGRHLRPSLTTVVQPMAALGDTAVGMLTDRIGGVGPSSQTLPPQTLPPQTLPPQTLPRRTVELPVRLELRGSCGCAPYTARVGTPGGLTRRQQMRRARRYWWAVVLVVVVALLAPGTARASGDAVSPYGGLSSSQRASLLAIARDTWKFYDADVDQATSLPMDNLTFAGGSATPTASATTPRPRTSASTSGPSSPPATSA